MRSPSPKLVPLGILLAFSTSLAAQIAPGNLVVVRIGDGSAALTSAATPVFLDQYTTAGTPVGSIPLPTAVSGANRRLVCSGVATSEGFLNVSADGRYLLAAGYDAPVGTLTIASTSSATANRVVARIDRTGGIDASTALGDAYSAGNIRSAVSNDGSQLWTAGTGTNPGVRYAALGATTSTQLSTSVTNTRVVGIANGQLYVTSASGTFLGVCSVGSGLPTSSGQTITLLPGFPTTTGPSSYDFFFADATTVYVADDSATPGAGIQKWTLSNGAWIQQYVLSPAASVGCRGLTGNVSAGAVTLYATTALASANQLVAVTDIGPGSPFTPLATAPANTVLRGVRYVPRGSIVRTPHACGPTTIAISGEATVGGSITTKLGGVVGQPFVGLGVTLFNLPFCTCTVGHEWLLALPGSTLPLSIPSNPSLIGGRVGIQGADAFAPGGCAVPQITLTDTLAVTIG